MTRRVAKVWVALLLLLVSCTAPSPSSPRDGTRDGTRDVVRGEVCRVAPNGGPVQADRGIGGTGISTGSEADRTAEIPRLADRGIGGTGIVGTITGFASVCVNGLEVAYDPATPVAVDGVLSRAEDLRVGNIAVIEAGGTGAALGARSIAVRHEVSGPVEAVEEQGRRLWVAGQAVAVSAGVRGGATAKAGDWIAVSGLRDAKGTIAATRIDARAPGPVIVHGPLRNSALGGWIGRLAVQPAAGVDLPPDGPVVAVGDYRQGVLHVLSIAPDWLTADPTGVFGRQVGRLVIESYASVTDGQIRLGPSVTMHAEGLAPRAPGLAIVEMERRNGEFVPTSILAPAGNGPQGSPSAPFDAAPMPPQNLAPAGVPGGKFGPADAMPDSSVPGGGLPAGFSDSPMGSGPMGSGPMGGGPMRGGGPMGGGATEGGPGGGSPGGGSPGGGGAHR